MASKAVVVTDCKYRMAVPILRSLKRAGYFVVAAEYEDVPEAQCLGFASHACDRRIRMPRARLVDWLLALPETLGLAEPPAIIPVGIATIGALAESEEQWRGKLRTIVPSPDVLNLCNDTGLLLRAAGPAGVHVPKTATLADFCTLAALADTMPYPCVIKYREGEKLGLKPVDRYRIVRDKDSFLTEYARMHQIQPNPLAQEYIEGDGYGVGLVLGHDSRVQDLICHRRIRQYPVAGGPSACCQSIWDEELAAAAIRLMEAIGYTGVGMVEFKGAPGRYTLMEINPRFWGASPLIDVCGSHFYETAASLFSCEAVPPVTAPSYRPHVKMRYFPQDVLARIGLSKTKPAKLGQALCGLFDLGTKEGLFRMGDQGPFWRYIRENLGRHI